MEHDMSAAWGVGLLRLSQRQCGLVDDSNLLASCVLFICVCGSVHRASKPEVPGGGALPLVGWVFYILGGRQRRGQRISGISLWRVAWFEVGGWLWVVAMLGRSHVCWRLLGGEGVVGSSELSCVCAARSGYGLLCHEQPRRSSALLPLRGTCF